MYRSNWITLLIAIFSLVGLLLATAVLLLPSKQAAQSQKDMVLVPKGAFYMGCEPELIDDCSPNEFPRHRVNLDDFFIDKYETTCAQYAQYLNENNPDNQCFGNECISPEPEKGKNNIQNKDGKWVVDRGYENRPMLYVTWYGAKAYCEHLGKDLPTEAQWEKTAKGGKEHYIFPWGDRWIENASNFTKQGDPFEGKGFPETTPVGFFNGKSHKGYKTYDGRSIYGAFDMAGNAKEWTADWYDKDYYKESHFGGWKNPTGPQSGVERVIKGASWSGDPRSSRISYRIHMSSLYRDDALGFRCVKND